MIRTVGRLYRYWWGRCGLGNRVLETTSRRGHGFSVENTTVTAVTNGPAPILWEVGVVYRHPWEPTPHVKLHRVGAPADVKTIALATLRDERYFAPAG